MKSKLFLAAGWFLPLFSFAQCWVAVSDTVVCESSLLNISSVTDEQTWEQLNSYEVQSIDFEFVDLSKSENLSLGDDQIAGPFSIGFDFTFFNEVYSQFWISSNGFISFIPETYGGYGVWDIPDLEGPYSCVFGVWEDLNPGAGGEIKQTSLPGKSIISFENVASYNCGGAPDTAVSFQIVLLQEGNAIEIHTANKYDCTVSTQGIQGPNGVFAFTPEGRNAENWSLTNDAVRFTSQTETSVDWYDANNQLIGTGVSTWIDIQETSNFSVVLNNSLGCVDSDEFLIQVSIQEPFVNQSGAVLLCDLNGYEYQWYENGIAIEGANSQYIIPEESGIYSVEIYDDETGCFKESVPYLYNISSVVSDFILNFMLYPNPSNQNIVKCFLPEEGFLEIYDLKGSLIYKKNKARGEHLLSLNSSGVYLVQYLSATGKRDSQKLIIQ